METIEMQMTFPDDIVEEILSRLSVRQLLQFRCVSKSWCALIDSPGFIVKHNHTQYAVLKQKGDAPLLIDTKRFYNTPSKFVDPVEFYILSKRFGDVPLCVTPDLERDTALHAPKNLELFRTLRLAGLVNGVVLLVWNYSQFLNSYLALWNPATREFKVVRPRRPRSHRKYHGAVLALGFDPKSNDFKIIRSINNEWTADYEYELYSLKNNTWKSIKGPSRLDFVFNIGHCDGCMNGAYYWPCAISEPSSSLMLLALDLSNEVFEFLNSPPFDTKPQFCGVGKYMDSLAFICDGGYDCNDYPLHYDVWVTTSHYDDNNGNLLSWRHLFRVGPLLAGGCFLFHSFRLDADMIVTIDVEQDFESVLYNPVTKTVSKRFGFVFNRCYEYVQSLFRLSK